MNFPALKHLLTLSIAVCFSLSASAQTFSNNTPFAVPDGAIFCDGTPGVASAMINVSGLTGNVTDISFEIGLNATWIGDVTITIAAPGAAGSITVLNRPGSPGAPGCGDSSNAFSSSPLTFDDAAVADAELLGTNLPMSDDVVCQDDGICDFFPNPDEFGGNLSFAALIASVGTSSANHNGDWTITVSDGAGGDDTSVEGLSLTFTTDAEPIPTMGEWGIIILFILLSIIGIVFMMNTNTSWKKAMVKTYLILLIGGSLSFIAFNNFSENPMSDSMAGIKALYEQANDTSVSTQEIRGMYETNAEHLSIWQSVEQYHETNEGGAPEAIQDLHGLVESMEYKLDNE